MSCINYFRCYFNNFFKNKTLLSEELITEYLPNKLETITTVAKPIIATQTLSSKYSTFESKASFIEQVVVKKYTIQSLGKDSIFHFLSYLDLESFRECSFVNKKWSEYCRTPRFWNSFDLAAYFPSVTFFTLKDWNTYFEIGSAELDLKTSPQIDKRSFISTLEGLVATLNIESDSGITVLEIPAGLSLNKLKNFSYMRFKGDITNISLVLPKILSRFGDVCVSKPYTVVVTNNILLGTRMKLITDQITFVNRCVSNPHKGQLPSILHIFSLMAFQFPDWKNYYYDNIVPVYSLCNEELENKKLIIGDVGPLGINLNFACNNSYSIGAGIEWKFEGV